MSNRLNRLDSEQVIRSSAVELESGELATRVAVFGGNLVPNEYDKIELTYITVGPGTGEIGTVVYKFDSNTVATLTLTYDGSNRLIDVARS
jgi:hypothetical protein